jgi:hypothetical protein
VRILGAAGAAALLVLTAACSATGSTPTTTSGSSGATDDAAVTPSATELSCTGAVTTGPLPVWARDGFAPPDQAVPHVVGDKGEIVGVVLGQPLHAPPQPGRSNKILWVARPGETANAGDSLGTELAVSARLNGVGTVATTSLAGGPGPSVIDLPAPGCWTVTLTWSGRTDTVALPYLA